MFQWQTIKHDSKSASFHIFGHPPKIQLVLIASKDGEVLEQDLWENILKQI